MRNITGISSNASPQQDHTDEHSGRKRYCQPSPVRHAYHSGYDEGGEPRGAQHREEPMPGRTTKPAFDAGRATGHRPLAAVAAVAAVTVVTANTICTIGTVRAALPLATAMVGPETSGSLR